MLNTTDTTATTAARRSVRENGRFLRLNLGAINGSNGV